MVCFLLQGIKAPEVRIKWPNDLYAKGLKVGGVLCTSTYSAKKFHIVVGEYERDASLGIWCSSSRKTLIRQDIERIQSVQRNLTVVGLENIQFLTSSSEHVISYYAAIFIFF